MEGIYLVIIVLMSTFYFYLTLLLVPVVALFVDFLYQGWDVWMHIPRNNMKETGLSWTDIFEKNDPHSLGTDDYRLFCGDLGNEVNDDVLSKAFSRFPTFNMAKVVRDKRTGKTKGYGFVSFSNPLDLAAALKEMNGKYVGNRPIKLRKSKWQERIDYEALESHKNRSHKKPKQAKKGIFHK